MRHEFFGVLSAALVAYSALPYIKSAWKRQIKPNLTTWALWVIIGISLLLTYRGAGAGWNVAPAIIGVINPSLLVAVILLRGGKREPIKAREYACIVLSLGSLAGWWYFRGNEQFSTYALCLAIVADICAAVPALIDCWERPHDDRPGAWAIFSVGYAFALPAITDWKFSNVILPVYMFILAGAIAWPLAAYRLKNQIPLREWI